MPRQPSEQNLPDNVTNADIEKHFGYGDEEKCINGCIDPVYKNKRCYECYVANTSEDPYY